MSSAPDFAIARLGDTALDPLDVGRVVLSAYQSLDGYVPESRYEVQLVDVAGRAAHSEILVATDAISGAILGCATVVTDPASPMSESFKPGEVGLRMLGVSPLAQGRGVGRALVDETISMARAVTSCTSVVLHSTQYMTAAHGLYERMGFVREPDLDIDLMDSVGIRLLFFRLRL